MDVLRKHFLSNRSAIMASGAVILLSILIHLYTSSTQADPAADSYVAAVVEYSGIYDPKLTPLENAKNNAERHSSIIKRATTNRIIDIIVFPELGLLNYDHSLFIEVPDPKNEIAPYLNDSYHEVLKIISKAAQESSLYVVVNLHESYKNGTQVYRYNTNVVFNRKGVVIARYRKYNLFGETYLNRTESPEYVYFKTDFGVTFGTFICFDIIFEEPALGLINKYNITDIVYPTAWFSELPFHVGIQEQSAWAYATDVNLLASGYNNISSGNSGSGIYAGKSGPIAYIQSENADTIILIGKVPKKSAEGKTDIVQGEPINYESGEKKSLPILHENLKLFNTTLLKPEEMTPKNSIPITIDDTKKTKGLQQEFVLNEDFCHDDFCCNFNLSFTVKYYPSNYDFKGDLSFNKPDAFYHYRYRLVAFNGTRNYIVGNSSGQQVCALMPCLNDTLEGCAQRNDGTKPFVQIKDKDLGQLTLYSTTFTNIDISGDFPTERVLVLPSILMSSPTTGTFGQILDPKQFKLNIEDSENTSFQHVSLSITPKEFASGGILTRLFERDNKPNGNETDKGGEPSSDTPNKNGTNNNTNGNNKPGSATSLTNSFIWCLTPFIFYLLYSH